MSFAISRLADGLHYRILDDVPILLDARQGRYFLLRGELARCFCSFVSGKASAAELDTLAHHRLAEPNSHHRETEDELIPATGSWLDRPLPRVSAMLVGEAVMRQWSATRSLRRHGFVRLVDNFKKGCVHPERQGRRTCATSEAAISAAFLRAQRLISATDQCLPRSLAMAAMLRRHGHAANIVMGVQLPFAAHCWVQCGERGVSDPLERIDTFEPILVL